MTEQQGARVIKLLEQLLELQPRADNFRDGITLKAALAIEDLFATGHLGGRTQRLAKVQIEVRRAIEACGAANND